MRFAIVSDIHANLQAWNAALLDIRCNDIDRILCLGDIVGYGPNPAEVLKSVHAHVNYMVLGNHDAVVCGKLDADLFNKDARDIIAWTRQHLNQQAVAFLNSLPLSLASAAFRCTHGDFSQPEAFLYIIDPEDAVASWQARGEQLLFVGHTHEPAIFVQGGSGTPHRLPPQDFVIEEGKRYIVNPGSIGQPRDGEPRASYCIFDSADRAIFWRRIPFDMDAYRDALSAAGLPAKPSYFLRHDPRAGTPPIRELLNFSPPTSAAQTVRNVVEVRDMETLQRRVARWKGVTALIALLSLAAGGAGGWLWWRQHHRACTIAPMHLAAVSAEAVSNAGVSSRDQRPIPDNRNLLPVPVRATDAGDPIEGWSIRLGHRRRQTASTVVQTDGSMSFLLASSTAKDELALSSRPIRARPQDRFRLYGEFQNNPGFSGQIAVYVDVRCNGRLIEYDWRRSPPDVQQGDWLIVRRVFPTAKETFPDGQLDIEISVRGTFIGEVRVRNLGLGRIEYSKP